MRKIWLIVLFTIAITLGISFPSFAEKPDDWVPPGHRKPTGDSSSSATATSSSAASASSSASSSASATSSPTINVNSNPQGDSMFDDGAFRQFPETVQPRFPSFISQSPTNAGTKVLSDLSQLPKTVHGRTVRRNQDIPECQINIIYRDDAPEGKNFHPDYVTYYHEGKGLGGLLGKPYKILADVEGVCKGGNTFHLDMRIREKAMLIGGNGIVYVQKGQMDKPSAWSVGLFGGGVTAQLGGQGKDKSISVNAGLGFGYGEASLEEIPALMGHIIATDGWR